MYNNNTKYCILITYAYFETEMAKKNLNFFIHNGVFDVSNVYYNFIIKSINCSINIPQQDNIKVHYTENKGYDFAAYSYSVKHTNNKEYDYYIFLNDTVRGPFVPRYIPKSHWFHCFIQFLNEKTKLVGATINRKEYNNTPKHVQSMCFATDLKGIKMLQEKQIFDIKRNIEVFEKHGKYEYIIQFEIGMSKMFLNEGYSIDSLLQVENSSSEPQHGDIHFPNLYYGITPNPLEIMFIKTNRINDLTVCNYTQWNL